MPMRLAANQMNLDSTRRAYNPTMKGEFKASEIGRAASLVAHEIPGHGIHAVGATDEIGDSIFSIAGRTVVRCLERMTGVAFSP